MPGNNGGSIHDSQVHKDVTLLTPRPIPTTTRQARLAVRLEGKEHSDVIAEPGEYDGLPCHGAALTAVHTVCWSFWNDHMGIFSAYGYDYPQD
jgi:hypothetical protein